LQVSAAGECKHLCESRCSEQSKKPLEDASATKVADASKSTLRILPLTREAILWFKKISDWGNYFGGAVSGRQQKAQVNKELNGTSHTIYNDKHSGK
jgi:hypothetical protein